MLNFQFLISSLFYEVWNILSSHISDYCSLHMHLWFYWWVFFWDLSFKYVIALYILFCNSSVFCSENASQVHLLQSCIDFPYACWFYFSHYIYNFSTLCLISTCSYSFMGLKKWIVLNFFPRSWSRSLRKQREVFILNHYSLSFISWADGIWKWMTD